MPARLLTLTNKLIFLYSNTLLHICLLSHFCFQLLLNIDFYFAKFPNICLKFPINTILKSLENSLNWCHRLTIQTKKVIHFLQINIHFPEQQFPEQNLFFSKTKCSKICSFDIQCHVHVHVHVSQAIKLYTS